MSYVDHIVSQIRTNVDFLVREGHMSQQDAEEVSAHLPSGAVNSQQTQQAKRLIPAVGAQQTTKRTVPAAPPPPSSRLPKARALWAYNENGSDPDDLSFKAGDVIEIVEETNDDWWSGKVNGKQGLFPSNYVEKITVPSDSGAGHRIAAPPPAYGPLSTGATQMANEKAPYKPFNAALHGTDAPPLAGSSQVNSIGLQEDSGQEKKQSKYGRLGNTMANSAAGGVGFGAGAAIGSGLVRAIF